jgi:hypothetical protein
MPAYAPFSLEILDQNTQQLFSQLVPFEFELSVTHIMERAFALAQTPQNADPFVFEVQYYGYSESAQFPVYLGYEIESLCNLSNSAQYYWELLINEVASQVGADLALPPPGATVTWQYTPVPANPQQLTERARAVHARRARRGRANAA